MPPPDNKSDAPNGSNEPSATTTSPAESGELITRRRVGDETTATAAEVKAAKEVGSKQATTALVDEKPIEQEPELPIVWKNVVLFIYLHSAALYGLYLVLSGSCKLATVVFAIAGMFLAALGITAGAHRLWAHRTYKAKLPLRIFLGILQTFAGQNSIYEWCRDHRVHHKHSETNADPHNAKRGFFFAHMGWLLQRKHPDVFRKGSRVPLDDLLEDPVVYYQKKIYVPAAAFMIGVVPTVIPMYYWNESFANAFYVAAILRYCLELHFTWLVNSAAHLWGNKPYDMRINPVENFFVVFFSIGEGFHNYHHTFPRDYAASEFGLKHYNLSKGFIDLMAWCGQAYDLVRISPETVLKRRQRTGDLSEYAHGHGHSHGDNDDAEYPY